MLSLFPISVEFPLTPLREVEGVSLIMLRRIAAMDTARLIVNLTPEDVNRYVSAGSPFKATWYAKGVKDEFVGYVHSFRPINEGYRQRTVIIAIGTAYPMFNEPGRTYFRSSIDHVVEDICEDYRFQLEIDPHPLVQEQIIQQDGSDWTFIQRLADQWGYVFMVDGVTMIFRLMENVLKENYRQAEREHTSSLPTDSSSNLREFKPSFSALNKVPYSRSVGSGVDPIQLHRIAWDQPNADDSIFQDVMTAYPSASEVEGELLGVGQAARTRFPYSATAQVQTPVGKKPMDVYQITHEGERMTWVVQSVKHIITGDNYVGEMELGSDGKDYVQDFAQKQLDVESLINMSRSRSRSQPVIINSRPYYAGIGASVAVKDQRWVALSVDGRMGRRSAG
jgi:hypothetical protein